MKIVVLDAATLCFPEEEWAPLRALGTLAWYERTPHHDRALIRERCAGAEVVLTNKVPLDAGLLAELPALRLISVLATGYDIIDVAAARARGITVCNVRGYSTAGVAQHTVAMILHAASHLGYYPESVRAGDWVRGADFFYLPEVPRELSELTIGIIGFGTIGRRVGALLAPFGPRILASQRTPREPPAWPDFAFAEVGKIFAEADIVTLHCPQTPETTRMANARTLAGMKRGAWLINTARGGLVDESALAESLARGHLGGAWLDVVDGEPMRADNPLRLAPRCFITPHIAWATEPARRRLFAETLENLRAFAAGNPRHVVSI
jgi:glycerate dehydrogenase